MRHTVTTIAALVAAQALMLGVWYAVERGRQREAAPEAPPPRPSPRAGPMDRPAPALELQRRDGTVLRLAELRGRPLVLHFWATWCPPCREELPALLSYAAEGDLPVLAVSLDPDWGAVQRFLGQGPPPGAVVLADGRTIEEALDVRRLPVTFIVDPGGSLRLRLEGPQDWASAEAREAMLEAARL